MKRLGGLGIFGPPEPRGYRRRDFAGFRDFLGPFGLPPFFGGSGFSTSCGPPPPLVMSHLRLPK